MIELENYDLQIPMGMSNIVNKYQNYRIKEFLSLVFWGNVLY